MTLYGIMLTVLHYIILYCIVLCYKTTSMCLYAVLLSMPEAG